MSVGINKLQAPLRVLMVAACPFPWPRGTPVRIQRLAEALVEQGDAVDVVTYHLGKTCHRLPFKVHRTTKVFYYNRVSAGPSLTKLLLLDPMLVRCLLKVAKTGHYDIIHAHHIEGVMAALAARALGLDLPIVFDVHTLAGSELLDYGPPIGSGLKRWVGDFLDHYLARKADSVIAVTDSIKTALLLQDVQPENHMYDISNGVEDHFIESARRARQGYSAVTAEPVFIYAGNTAAYQGIELMLEAFALVVKRVPGARLRILSHEPFTEYQSLAASLGIADRLSVSDIALDELPAALVQADGLLNPRTRCAGIPQKLLNYMAAGRPVVSFAGSAKIVSNRVDGLVVENGDVQAFADAMLELVGNPGLGEALSGAALKLILQRFSWSSSAQQVQKVYCDTLTRYA